MKWLVRNSPLKQLSTVPPDSATGGVGKGLLLTSCSRQETLAVDIPGRWVGGRWWRTGECAFYAHNPLLSWLKRSDWRLHVYQRKHHGGLNPLHPDPPQDLTVGSGSDRDYIYTWHWLIWDENKKQKQLIMLKDMCFLHLCVHFLNNCYMIIHVFFSARWHGGLEGYKGSYHSRCGFSCKVLIFLHVL